MKKLIIVCLLLSACADTSIDYDASKQCHDQGFKAGTKEYDNCINQVKSERMLNQQRQEYEQMKRREEDWKMLRY